MDTLNSLCRVAVLVPVEHVTLPNYISQTAHFYT